MRAEESEGKMARPLFPRLHVNDTDKGGPKPPPRNKMALYEQLSIPSQRFTDAPTTVLPLPPVYASTLAVTDTLNHGRGSEKSGFSPFQTSAASYHSSTRQGSFSADGLLNESNGNSIKRLMPTAHTRESNDVTQSKWPSRLKNEVEFKARSSFHPAVNSDACYNQSSLNRDRYLKDADEPGQGHDRCIRGLPLEIQENAEAVTTIVKARDNRSPAANVVGALRVDAGLETRLLCSHSNLRREDDNESGVLPGNVLNGTDDRDPTSNTLASGGASCGFVSPDDVVEMIGYKQFWKVRRAIINQQRIFSMQVFELHRIIKVQRIIASSRHVPTDDIMFSRKPSSLKEQPVTPTLVPEKIKLTSDNPFQHDSISSGLTKNAQKLEQPAFTSSTLDNSLPMWNLLPPVGNQWLVPVMSPSEGLIYKPYNYKQPSYPPTVGYDPPTVGYDPTLYGFNHIPVPPPVGPKYFDPYGGTPAITPSIPVSAVDEAYTSIEEKQETKRVGRASSVALPLFPTAPTGCGTVPPVGPTTQGNVQTSRVIKVVPHNPRLASESTARIIELIQEERKHLCN